VDAFAGKRIFLIGGENELAELGGMSFEQITPARFVRAYTAIRMLANAWTTRGLPRHRVWHRCDRSRRPWWSDRGRDVVR